VKSYIEEAKKFGKIDSPYVSKIYDIGKYYERLFLVLEYADGADLLKVLKHRKMNELEAAQMGLILGSYNLGINPGNADFQRTISSELRHRGFAKIAEMPLNAESGALPVTFPGMPDYGIADYVQSDIYSLGITSTKDYRR
jgi:hypothetical protein